MAVALDASSVTDTAGSTNTTLSLTTLTVGNGSNRALIAFVGFDTTGITGITQIWDSGGTNQTMTAITGASATGSATQCAMFGLVNPISGNKTLKASWTGAANCILAAASYTGTNQTGGNTTFPHGTNTSGTSTGPSIAITTATNNACAAGFLNDSSASFNSVDHTQLWRDNPTGVTSGGNTAAPSNASSVTLGATMSKSKFWLALGTDILAAANVFGGAFSEPEYIRSSLIAVGYH